MMFGFSLSSIALAQDENQISAIVSQIQQLRDQLSELENQFYRSDDDPVSRREVSVESESLNNTAQLQQAAQFEIRLSALEEEFRRFTGLLEQISYNLNQNSQLIERSLEDVEFRINSLEQNVLNAPESQSDQNLATLPAEDNKTNTETPVGIPVPPGGAPGLAGAQVLGVLSIPKTTGEEEKVNNEDSSTPEERYQIAYSMLQQFRTSDAEIAFRSFLETFPDHKLAINAHYWLGETYYARQMYADAAKTFFEAYSAHPEGEKAPDNFLKLGMSLMNMGETENACAVFTDISQRFPNLTGEIPSQAKMELSRLACP